MLYFLSPLSSIYRGKLTRAYYKFSVFQKILMKMNIAVRSLPQLFIDELHPDAVQIITNIKKHLSWMKIEPTPYNFVVRVTNQRTTSQQL